MSELLSTAEIRDLAGCGARESQCAKLDELGVPYMRDGARIIVSREHVRRRILGERLRQSAGPRLDLVK